jgi:hypothetical protein
MRGSTSVAGGAAMGKLQLSQGGRAKTPVGTELAMPIASYSNSGPSIRVNDERELDEREAKLPPGPSKSSQWEVIDIIVLTKSS